MTKETWLILTVALVVFIVMAVGISIRERNVKIVKRYSRRLQELRGLNQRTMFYGGGAKGYEYYQSCKSKRQFDNLAIEEYLLAVLEEDRNEITAQFYQIEHNRKNYAAYLKECDLIVPMETEEKCAQWKISFQAFLKHEKRLFKKTLLEQPTMEMSVTCIVGYQSPQGKNHYEKEHTYDYAELKYYFERLAELKETRKTRQYQIKIERAKMTDSLRYDIMKRDNFRCQLCGSTAADGVKLHVDHILPVAKGGKTKPENLRTLCDRCNMGKSDKYE